MEMQKIGQVRNDITNGDNENAKNRTGKCQ